MNMIMNYEQKVFVGPAACFNSWLLQAWLEAGYTPSIFIHKILINQGYRSAGW